MFVVELVLFIYAVSEVVQVIPHRANEIKFRWHARQMKRQLIMLFLNV